MAPSFRLLARELAMLMRVTNPIDRMSTPATRELIGSNQRLMTWLQEIILTFGLYMLQPIDGMSVVEVSMYDATPKTLRYVLAMGYRHLKTEYFPDRIRTSKIMKLMLHFTSGKEVVEEACSAYKVAHSYVCFLT